jgi:hypothetical protein
LADATRFRHIAKGYSDKGWIVFIQRRLDIGDLLFRGFKVIGDAKFRKFEGHCHASFAILLATAMSFAAISCIEPSGENVGLNDLHRVHYGTQRAAGCQL